MKHVWLLALRYLRFNKVTTVILVFSVAVAVFLPLAVNLLVREYQRDLLARARATPLVAGAPGSRLDLVLHALYFRGRPAHDLTLADVDALNASGLALALPLIDRHTARGFPIVGTSLEYFDFRGLRVADGAGLTRLGDCVLGAAVAAKLALRPGDRLMSDPENVFDLAGSYPVNLRVTGLLAPAGTADDAAVFVDVKTAWLIQGHYHGHQDAAKADPSLLLSRAAGNVTASAALLPYQEVTATNLASFHLHGDGATLPVGAAIAVPRDDKSSAILRGRYQDPKAAVQLLVPEQVVAETFELVFRIKRFFDAQAVLVGVAMALLLALVVLLSLRLRRGEMETMFKIGCARWTIFWMQAVEVLIVVAAGLLLAAGSSWLLLRELGLSAPRGDGAASAPGLAAAARDRKSVAVVNYPLQYFARRIAGEHVKVVYPIPGDGDPAFWEPADEDLARLQKTDLILLNGAEYEKWLPTATLAMTRQLVTSLAFADRYMTNGMVATHSHGPGGMHRHGLLAFTTWLDPQLAAAQAQSVRDGLARLQPGAQKEFEASLVMLQKDLSGLGARLAEVSARVGRAPLLASHPVYQYLARAYGWNLESMHWEPDEMPSAEEWVRFSEIHAKHPARIMIWEAEPLPAVAQRLRAIGVEPVVFDPCANAPATGDYVSAMNANVDHLLGAMASRP